jgi:hypothetical protein
MKKIYLFLLFHSAIYMAASTRAQIPPAKIWDYRYGGTNNDNMILMSKTNDGGLLLGGNSISGIGGDKTQPIQGSVDYWILKINANGVLQWDRNYGGLDLEQLHSLLQTADGGLLISGTSYSDTGGHKTAPSWGGRDIWILKTDANGNIEWDKDYGGTDYEWTAAICPAAGGGYLIACGSESGIGGNKTEASYGSEDYWVVRIDSNGTVLWDKTFGGTYLDFATSVVPTADGGFLMGGWSRSPTSGNKTHPGFGNDDFWIVKIDSMGNQQWDQAYGGSSSDFLFSIAPAFDGGYMLGGVSYSGADGNKTDPGWGLSDLWVVRIDSVGNKLWDHAYGGTAQDDDLKSFCQTIDGGFLIAGASYSSISGDKTENNLGSEQPWIIKVDSAGSKEWDNTLLLSDHVELGLAVETNGGCIFAGSTTVSGIAGDKTQNSWGGADYWIIKFCDTTGVPSASFYAPQVLCPGTCINFTNTSVNSHDYQWRFPGAIPDTSTAYAPTNICYIFSGSYDVTLTAFNSNGSDSITLLNYITVLPQPSPQSITQNGDTLFALAGATAYQWYFNGNHQRSNGFFLPRRIERRL